jgi:hypothetical protein
MDLPPQELGYDILPADDLFWGTAGGAGLNAKKGVYTEKLTLPDDGRKP